MRELAASLRDVVAAQALGGRLHLALSASGALLQKVSTAWQRTPEELGRLRWDGADPTGDAEALALRCAPLLDHAGRGRLPLHVTLASEHVRLFMVAPPANAARPQDLRLAAQARLHALYGDDPQAWRVEVDGEATRPFLACATPAARVAAVQRLARERGLCLAAVVPLFVEVWNRSRARLDGGWLGLRDGQSLTLAACAPLDAGLRAVHRVALPAHGGDSAWLRQQVERFALREGLPMPVHMQLLRQRDLAPVEPDGQLRFPQAGALAPAAVPPIP